MERDAHARRHSRPRPDGREAPPARHARLRARRPRGRDRDRGPDDDGRARRRGAGDRDRPRATAAGRERRLCQRDALSRARLRRHPLGLGQPRLDRDRTGGTRRRRAAGRQRARHPGGDRRRQRGRLPDRHGRIGRVPRARIPSDRDLRGLRRGRRDRSDRSRRRRHDHERARNRRLVRRRALRLPRRRDADEADAPRLGGARRAPRDAARRARGGRAAVGARGEVRALPRLPRRRGRRDRHRRSARRSRLALGDAPDRLQAVPGLPLHARLARCDAGAANGRTFAADEIDDVLVSVPEAGVSLVLEPAEQKRAPRSEYEGKFSLQYSVASMLVRGHVSVGRLHRRGDRRPRRARRRVEGALRDARVSPPTRRRSPAACVVSLATGRRSRPTSRIRRAGPRTRCRRTRCGRSSARTPSLALSDAPCDRLEEAILALEEHDDLTAALAPLTLGRRCPHDRRGRLAADRRASRRSSPPSARSSTAT